MNDGDHGAHEDEELKGFLSIHLKNKRDFWKRKETEGGGGGWDGGKRRGRGNGDVLKTAFKDPR